MQLSRRRMVAGLGLTSLATPFAGRAQEALDARNRFLRANLYLPEYLEQKAAHEAGDARALGRLAQHASLVGDEDIATRAPPPGSPPRDIPQLESAPAIATLVERARDARIVILNEAHHVSRHRHFAEQVLTALQPLGFSVFAAETFSWGPDIPPGAVNTLSRGEAFGPQHGYYSRDPVYAEAVRAALELGYRLEGYEDVGERDPQATRDERINRREEAQARNFIANVLERHPGEKAFVLCGFNHLIESPVDQLEWFASRLKRLTGIDPLTIEQSGNYPALDPAFDPPLTRALLERVQPTEPVAVFEPGGRALTTDPYLDRVDLSVFHPRLASPDDRPGWLHADPTRRAVTVTLPPRTGVALVQAVRMNEGLGAIPSDQAPVAPERSSITLLLKPGPYLLTLESLEGLSVFGQITVA